MNVTPKPTQSPRGLQLLLIGTGLILMVVGFALTMTWLMPATSGLPVGYLLGGIGGMALGLWLVGMGGRVGMWARQLDRWILNHAAAIEGGGAPWGEYTINRDTELCQFEAAVSYLFGTFTPRTPLLLVDAQAGQTRMAAAACLVVTLAAGWWSVPFGPITTLRVLWVNAGGGHQTTVGRRLDELRGYPPRLPWITPRAADFALATMERKRYPPTAALYIGPDKDPDQPLSVSYSPSHAHDDCWFFIAHDLPVLLHHDVTEVAPDFIIDADPTEERFIIKRQSKGM